MKPNIKNFGNSLVVQWLGLSAFTAGTRVQALVWELRYRKLCGTAKRKKEEFSL